MLRRWVSGQKLALDPKLISQIRTLLGQVGGMDPAQAEALIQGGIGLQDGID